MNLLISLYDRTGNWSRPYREAGWKVMQVDIQHGVNILNWNHIGVMESMDEVFNYVNVGILAAVPCTDYAVSGAKHFALKDKDGRTEASQLLVDKTKAIIDYINPHFWVIENPKNPHSQT